jgi:hypothetical protein
MSSACARFVALLLAIASGYVAGPETTLAQDVEPRALLPAPVGTNAVGAAFSGSFGDVLLDKTLPVEDLDGTIIGLAPSYTRYFNTFGVTTRLTATVPLVTGSWDGAVQADPTTPVDTTVDRTGFGDGVLNATVFLVGAPAMTPQEFRDYRAKTVVGFNLRVKVPIGQYDPSKLINLGSNRWQVAPALALSQWIGNLSLEAYALAWLFSDNDALLGDNVLSQAPLYAFQFNVGYNFNRNLWLSAGVRQTEGGRTTLNGVERDDPTRNTRLGIVIGLPLAPQHTLKLAGTTGLWTTAGNDFNTLVAQWVYIW